MMTGLAGLQRSGNHEWLFLVFAICMCAYASLIMNFKRKCKDVTTMPGSLQYVMALGCFASDLVMTTGLQICMCAKSNFQNEFRRTDFMTQK